MTALHGRILIGLVASTAISSWAQSTRSYVISNCDSAQEWRGGTLVTDNVKEGKGAILWDHGKSARLAPTQTPRDWSQYNELSFWLFSQKATGAKFMLIVQSENKAAEGADYYSVRITADFSGWKHFRLAVSDDFGKARKPRGWDQIDGMYFTASGWGNTPDANTSVIIDSVLLTWEAERLGPRMTDEEFFAALQEDYPGLDEAHRLAKAGDFQSAEAAFVRHIKTRGKPKYFVDWRDRPKPKDRPKRVNTRKADFALDRNYRIARVTLQFKDEIDWKANPTDPFNPEWTWQLGRFPWWSALGSAYWNTGDEKYAKHFVWELRSWVHKNLKPRRVSNSVGSRWRTIECGIRLAGSWPRAFNYFLSSPSFTDDDVVMIIKSMVEQAEYLCGNLIADPSRHNNWVAMEANGLGHVGVLFPEFRRAELWRKTAIERTMIELDAQVYPDGPQMELTTGYHYVSLGNFKRLAEIFMHNETPLPDEYMKKLERMWAAGMWAMMPDRRLPPVNDAWGTNVPRTLRDALQYFPERGDFRWIATNGKQGKEPDHASHFFPWAGWAAMRTGWGRDDNFLFFDVGPFGVAHQHEDKLAFQIHAYGKYLLIDVGSYAYERSPMRRYVVGPYAHNIVFVDGNAQNRRRARDTYANKEAQTNTWFTSDAADYCEGVYEDGFGPKRDRTVTHRREILFVKPDYWLVLDTLTPKDEAVHDYMALFHLGTDEASADSACARTLSDGPNLHISAASPAPIAADIVKGQEKPHYLGWIGKHGVHGKHPMPVARYAWKAKGVSRVLYVFCPTPAEKKPPIKEFRAQFGKDDVRGELDFASGSRDLVHITPEQWEVQRRSPDGSVRAFVRVRR